MSLLPPTDATQCLKIIDNPEWVIGGSHTRVPSDTDVNAEAGERKASRTHTGEHHRAAAEHLMTLVYDELRALAAQFMKNESPDHTLQPTALVHEAYLRLIDQTGVNWQGKAHFFAIAAQMIRRVLIDHGRRRKAAKRGSGVGSNESDPSVFVTCFAPPQQGSNEGELLHQIDIMDLDDALTRLAELNGQQARIVELRFFGGLTEVEVAHVLGVSRKTVVKHWLLARAWLSRELGGKQSGK